MKKVTDVVVLNLDSPKQASDVISSLAEIVTISAHVHKVTADLIDREELKLAKEGAEIAASAIIKRLYAVLSEVATPLSEEEKEKLRAETEAKLNAQDNAAEPATAKEPSTKVQGNATIH